MNSIIRKELRENALWAFLAFTALLLTFAYVITTQYHGGSITATEANNTFNNPAQTYTSYTTWMIFGAPLVALLIGALQLVREQRYDARAFLIHRPVSTPAIYAGKVIAGLGLYFAATLGWLAVVTAWFLTPGEYHFPGPFDLTLAEPDLVTILASATFYFAAQLIILRPARIWGSRALPLAAAIAATLGVLPSPDAVIAAVLGALFSLILGWAAYGSYLTRGDYAPQTRPQRAALATTLLAGATTVAAALIGVIASMVISAHPQPQAQGEKSEYALTQTGQIVVLHDLIATNAITGVTALSGRALPGASKKWDDYTTLAHGRGGLNYLSTTNQPTFFDFSSQQNYYSDYMAAPWNSGYRDPADTESIGPGSGMRYYYDSRRRVVDVYDGAHGRMAGYLGAALKLAPTIAAAGPFAGEPLNQVFTQIGQNTSDSPQTLYFPSAIYSLDPNAETLSVVAPAPAGAPLQSAAYLYMDLTRIDPAIPPALLPYTIYTANIPHQPLAVTAQYQAIATLAKSAITIYNPHSGRVLLTTPYAADPARYPSVHLTLADTPLRLYTVYALKNKDGSDNGSNGYLLRETRLSDGQLLQATTLPPINFGNQGTDTPNTTALIAVPLAAIGGIIAVQEALSLIDPLDAGALSASSLHDFILPALRWGSLGGLASVVVLLLALRPRYGWTFRTAALWSFAIFLLSWPGLLMILAAIPFQQCVLCPSCRRPRTLTQSACEHCHTDSLAPKPDGREIFEPSTPCDWSAPENEREPAAV